MKLDSKPVRAAEYVYRLTKNAIGFWLESNAISFAGALAFFTLFSIAPVVILAVQVIGLVMSTDAAMAQIMSQLQATVGDEAAEAVRVAVEANRVQESGILPTLIGLGAIVIGATTVFAQMQRSLNNVWSIAPRPSRNTVMAFLKTRLMSLTVVLSLGFVLMVSLLLSVILQAIMVFARDWLPIPGGLVMALETTVSIAVITLLFGTIFKVLPDAVLCWRDVFVGALLTALLFVLGRYSTGQRSDPSDLLPFLQAWTDGGAITANVPWAMCAFGPREAECALSAALLGGHAPGKAEAEGF